MNKIECDKCKTEFDLHLHIEKLDSDIERNYMKCPECGEEYTSFYTNHDIRERQRKMQKLWGKFRSVKSVSNKERLMKEIEEEKQKVKIAMEELKNSRQ